MAEVRSVLTLGIIISLVTCVADSLAASESPQETELRGTVIRVEGQDVRIEITSQMWPRIGDTLQLGSSVPGLDGLAFMAGEWTVTEVTPDYVLAEAGPGVERTPARDYQAIIQSANPQPRPVAGTGTGTGGPGATVTGGGGGGGKGDVFDEPIDLDEAAALYDGLLGALEANEPTREEYFERARAGDPEAQNQVGVYHARGDGVQQSYEEAARWYRLAADQGSLYAMTNLGGMYEKGEGVPQDAAEAVAWFRRAADQGLAIAQRRLGYCYQRGVGVIRDLAEAVRLYRLAAAQDYADAHNDLGVMYEQGWGVQPDQAQAVSWFRTAANLGNAWGYCNLAEHYESGQGVAADRNLAIQNYQAAARLGNSKAQDWLRGQGLSW